jgi:hypothetical protein
MQGLHGAQYITVAVVLEDLLGVLIEVPLLVLFVSFELSVRLRQHVRHTLTDLALQGHRQVFLYVVFDALELALVVSGQVLLVIDQVLEGE